MVDAITTLGQLLKQMGVNVRFYDLGRRIEKLSPEQFQSFEDLLKPYPRPYLQKALVGVVFWQQATIEQPSVWCLRLPLDEQGMLIAHERDLFLQHLLVAVGNNLDAAQRNKQLSAVLEGNPYVFTPAPEKLAAFNAKIKVALKLPPSQYFSSTLNFLEDNDYSDWQNIPLQGIADIAAHWQQKDCHRALLKSLPLLPTEVLISLSQYLENEAIDASLSERLLKRIESELQQAESNNAVIAACLRGLSFGLSATHRQTAVDTVIHSSDQLDIEIIASLATRLGPQLLTGANPIVFMELLALHSEQSFIGVMSELLYQPILREPFLAAMRISERSEQLSKAIGALLQPTHAVH